MTATPTSTSTTSGGTATDLALGFAEGSQQSGGWSVPSPYTLAVNWTGSSTGGSRPVAIADAPVTVQKGTVVTGPVITNANTQSASGGSLLLIAGTGLAVHGSGTANYVHGVSGSSVTIPTPSGMQAGDLVVVYLNSGNTSTTAPSGWTLQRQDGQGSVWTQTFASVPASLGKWSTTGSSGWTYSAISVGGSGTTRVDASGGGGAQTSRSVKTGSATATGP
jgi:hypothetical protein